MQVLWHGWCRGYYHSQQEYSGLIALYPYAHLYKIVLIVSFWRVIAQRLIMMQHMASWIHLHFEEPILSQLETTTVECAIVGGEPVEVLNLTLWRNKELLAHTNGRNLSAIIIIISSIFEIIFLFSYS